MNKLKLTIGKEDKVFRLTVTFLSGMLATLILIIALRDDKKYIPSDLCSTTSRTTIYSDCVGGPKGK